MFIFFNGNSISYNPTTLPSGNTLIDECAVTEKTDSKGGTLRSNIPSGVQQVGQNHGLYITGSLDGVGYSTYYGNYLIVHDTGVDVDVYVNYDSSSLGTNQWVYIH